MSEQDQRRYTDGDWLREKYHGEGLTMEEIADEAGVAPSTIYTHMERQGVERGLDERLEDPEALRELYHDEGLTTKEVAEELGVCKSTLFDRVDKHEIKWREGYHDEGEEADFVGDYGESQDSEHERDLDWELPSAVSVANGRTIPPRRPHPDDWGVEPAVSPWRGPGIAESRPVVADDFNRDGKLGKPDLVKGLADSGWSPDAMANAFGEPESEVRAALEEYGVSR